MTWAKPVALVLAGLLLQACHPAPDSRRYAAAERAFAPAAQEWRHYLGDSGFSHYSPLQQINRDNVGRLQLAWRYRAGGEIAGALSQLQCNPLVVKGILYGVSADLNAFALDAATGEELWRHETDATAQRMGFNPVRGLVYWEAGADQRILFSANSSLISLDARTGRPVRGFGDGGVVDLHTGLPDWAQEEMVLATTPGTVYGDLLIIGSRVSEFRGAAPGHVRAFDIRSGELRWVFRTIPAAGDYGADTWPEQTLARAGGANSWAGIAVDQERGIAFVPTGSATFDFYGGDRHGDNLFANSLVALDAATGERLWHYQFVRHDVWDRDLPAPPNLITLERDGQSIPAVAQATKSGHVFVFHRETGETLFPLEEVAVQGEPVPGERVAASQPLPLRPPPFTAQRFVPSSRSPEVAAYLERSLAGLDPHAQFRPPSLNGSILYPGMDGGAEWGGMAYDAASNTLYVNANEVPYLLRVIELAPGEGAGPELAYLMLCSACHGGDMRGDGVTVPSLVNLWERMNPWQAYQVVSQGRGRMPGFGMLAWYEKAAALWTVYTAGGNLQQAGVAARKAGEPGNYINAGFQRLLDQEDYPASQPPWGTLTAIDMNRAEIRWRIPLGDYPGLLGLGVSGLGAENYGGPVVTAGGLLFIAATPDRRLRAYDQHSGALLWSAELPAAGFATPGVYAVDGRQYVVIAAGGGKLGAASGSEYLAFALPR